MHEVDILNACMVAFGAVFALLGLLAIVMRALTGLFPPPEVRIDPAVVAAIATSVSTLIPGARVTRIEEE